MDVGCFDVDAFRERPIHENTFCGNANGCEEVAESLGRLRRRNRVQEEPLQLPENA